MFPTAINAATAATSTVAAAADATPPPVLVSAYNDSIAALVSGTSGELDGLVVIAGTGMISKGFRGGREVTAGGNGALIDSGSGYAIGLDILRSAFAAADGMGPATPLLQATMCFLQIERPEQMVDWLYADRSWERVARLAPLAFAYAAPPAADTDAPSDGMPPLPTSEEEADPTARAILDTAAAYLVRSLAAVAKQLDLQTDTDITMSVIYTERRLRVHAMCVSCKLFSDPLTSCLLSSLRLLLFQCVRRWSSREPAPLLARLRRRARLPPSRSPRAPVRLTERGCGHARTEAVAGEADECDAGVRDQQTQKLRPSACNQPTTRTSLAPPILRRSRS